MAATIICTDRVNYKAGVQRDSNLCGYEADEKANHVIRYTFSTAGLPEGANKITAQELEHYISVGYGTAQPLHFKITTSPTSHVAAGAATEDYDGDVVLTKAPDGVTYYMSIAETDVILLPDETYYLYIFPATTNYGIYYFRAQGVEIHASGAAGVVYIYNGSTFEAYQCYVTDGVSWALYNPYIFNGAEWVLY